ncbi:MAG TPA: BTAD domain-containing putative transcriptional regulator, partial [Actinomycetes bacterium]|nr:BTAD domain-containing putative transcriptional regulator [Actinomycetes bacterium]
MTAPLEFLLLGPLEARRRDRPVRLGSIKHRMLLAKLLLHPNQVVSTDELIDAVWGEEPPPTVKQSLQNHVAALRKAIEHGGGPSGPRTLVTRDPGYLVRVEPDQLDLDRFQRLAHDGRAALAAGDPGRAADLLRRALLLWRGPVLADVAASAGLAWPELVGVDELRVAALEARIEADLALGRHRELVGELEGLVRLHPLREHLHGQLMLALYRSGRQADALAAYRAARRTLVQELGIEPSVGLQRLEQAILAQDAALDLLAPARQAADPQPRGQGELQAAPDGQPADRADPDADPDAGPVRKLVTVLFVEVDEPAGEGGERDPEDVSSMLDRHLERVRSEVESFGGAVEHAIGAATMAVFGVPQTREDDPERAVRAALAVRDALAGGGVEVRAAVTTGEALVVAGAPPGARVNGDLVTTCARLQQAAPNGTVLVAEATGRATERAISYGPGGLLSLAGRAKPVQVWSALEPRHRTELDALAGGPVPLVGRDRELGLLLESFRAIRAGGRPRLVSLVGPPGIGKSRLVAELGRALDGERDLIALRQGRTLPYGQGITFWALREVVKAEAGILETDGAATVNEKLARVVAHALADDPASAARVAAHLRLLVGTGGHEPAGAGRGEEAFSAWRRFLRGLAARRPLVLVLEDLHWAENALLDFVDGLVEQGGPEPVPLLVVVTARPELLERRPAWGDRADAATIELDPLSPGDTTHLLAALLAHHGVPAEVGPALLAAVGGNPLFAEEYVRMLRDGPVGEELPLPETVHAIVAARLDVLSADEKAALHDAAVLGRVGWVGAVAAVGGHDPARLEACLERLEAKEFLYRAGRSSMAGEREYGFRHVLVRDVAYGQIPRAERAAKHHQAAAWLQLLGGEPAGQLARDGGSPVGSGKPGFPRVPGTTEGTLHGDGRDSHLEGLGHGELVAHHYQQALELSRAAGLPVAELEKLTRLALRDAGDRVTALGANVAAARYYCEALALWPADAPDRPELELRAGRARCYGEGAGEDLLANARDGLLALGDRAGAAEAEVLLAELAYMHSRPRSAHIDRALELVRDAPASPSKAAVLHGCMHHLMVADRHQAAIQVAKQALAMARSLRLREIEASALGTIGAARLTRGDPAGVAQMERCVAICDDLGLAAGVAWHINLGYALSILGDLRHSFATRSAARRAAERAGDARDLRWLELERTAENYWTGRWDEAVRLADQVVAQSAGGARHLLECECRWWRGRIRLARGELEVALEDADRALDLARESGDPQHLDPALAFAGRALLAAGRADEADKLLDELLGGLGG